MPAAHASLTVQPLPSLHVPPSFVACGKHAPDMSQMPTLQSSVASRQVPPGGIACWMQLPLTGSQTPLLHPFVSAEQFFGLPQSVAKHQPNIDPTQLVKASSDRKWDGEGTTNRSGKLTARMSAVVKAVSPTGNLWVQGDKIVSVNQEDQHIVVQGWVRPEDIDSQNQVLSTRLADARIDYYGVGVVGAKQRQPWGFWLFDAVWPF